MADVITSEFLETIQKRRAKQRNALVDEIATTSDLGRKAVLQNQVDDIEAVFNRTARMMRLVHGARL